MLELDGPALVLTPADCWTLVHRRDGDVAAAIGRLAAQYAAEQDFAAELEPAGVVARALNLSESALRHRLRRGTWPGQQTDGRWYAVPPDSPLAPRLRL